ncbi:PTS sugar transporter subunit IIA [Facklamia sp. DSM 111018]|uniref:PTS sugar transporter subunit IIA n=1 Tax=Facklamia lactis TaxID=2749967 RepID=A0ABS0LRS8_9LACT|nr:fructose PTS transporter subunit IIA [Facklamia lactis]MBG9986868.1 PTS sugar transporter subunit IIA [Facklamia lactis]
MNFIKPELVYLNQKFLNQNEALNFIAIQAVKNNIAKDQDSLLSSFIQREEEGSTGMMDGFAIPHAKHETINAASLMIVKLDSGLDWASMDGLPVEVIIALMVPSEESGTTHLKILSKLARLLMHQDVVNYIKESQSENAIAEFLNSKLEEA